MLPDWYKTYKNFIDNSIKWYLESYLNLEVSKPLEKFKEVLFYATSSGKRVRAILALLFFIEYSKKSIDDIKKDDDIIKFCIALEFLHAYSLIHDDLPCMDNDIYRRWQLTVWKKYSEMDWVLAWDILNTLAFEVLSEMKNSETLKIIKIFSHSIWFYWMWWGQIEDMYFEEKSNELDLDILIKLHNKKTWELIKTSVLWWVILSWNIDNLYDFERFWEKIGLAFQVKDDLLDIEWTVEETGKSVWWEEKGFVFFMWTEKSKQYLENLRKDCLSIISPLKSEKLEFLVDYVCHRKG